MFIHRKLLLAGTALLSLVSSEVSQAEEVLPEIVVQASRPEPARPAAPRVAPPSPEQVTAASNARLDAARDNLSPRMGATAFDINRSAIESLPQGTDASINKVLLQAPGVTQDAAASGELHVRNEHANLQYRINGILLPDGISGFGRVLDTGFVGNLAVLTGALPAQFGLRTSGVVDIQTPSGSALQQGGHIGIYGGSRGTITPSFDYGGRSGNTEYFFTGRYFQSDEGIENPTQNRNAIHDRTNQGNFFSYTSTLIDNATRFSTIFGNTSNRFQIPNNPGQPVMFGPAFGVAGFNSANVNDFQVEQNNFAVAALQKSLNGWDTQLAVFSRYSTLRFVPDVIPDLLFNGQASDVYRRSVNSGLQGDAAYRLNEAHTLRGGFVASAESTKVSNINTVLPADGSDAPFQIIDENSKLGGIFGAYVQDEWRITNKLTLNTGLRFDQMWQYVDANQLSPRINIVYKPFDDTTLHAGYARYFTPPQQVLAAPVNVGAFTNTATPPDTTQQDPVRPERSNYYDVGIVQKIAPGLQAGVDAYYKQARDLLDDGQFGQALVLNAFNYEKAINKGVEFTTSYTAGNFKAYANFAIARQVATQIVSNQYLFGADELAYIASHYVFTDHAQIYTGSGGVSYLWDGTRYSADLVYGSGLRSGFANTDHVGQYAQLNLGASHEFAFPDRKPITIRFDIVNALDTTYLIRDGSGIGVFAPQYGPRRGFFLGLSQKL